MRFVNKKTILSLIIFTFFVSIFYTVVPAKRTFAQPGAVTNKPYVPLAPLPDKFFTGTGVAKYELPSYLSGMFKFLLAMSGLLAVVMIVVGGIQYMSTDAISGKSEGKERITNAVLGLLLALISWLILYTINPKLLEFNLNSVTPAGNTQSAPR